MHDSRLGWHQVEVFKHHQPSGFNWSQVYILVVSSFHLVGVCECMFSFYLYLSGNWSGRGVPDSMMGLFYSLNCYLFFKPNSSSFFLLSPDFLIMNSWGSTLRHREGLRDWRKRLLLQKTRTQGLDTVPFLSSTPLFLTQSLSTFLMPFPLLLCLPPEGCLSLTPVLLPAQCGITRTSVPPCYTEPLSAPLMESS